MVPGTSWVTARRSPIRRLKRVDLPTFGRPTMATIGLGIEASFSQAPVGGVGRGVGAGSSRIVT